MSTIYLFAKQHNKTGLRYFGKTTRDPQKYHGSGLYWKSHLKEHGRDVTTTWVQAYTDAELASAEAAFFSAVYNIVDSDEWANLIPEDAKGGGSRKGREVPWLTGKKRPDHSSYMTGKMCGENNPMYGKKLTADHIAKLREGSARSDKYTGHPGNQFGKGNLGKIQTPEWRLKKSLAAKANWAKRKALKEQE